MSEFINFSTDDFLGLGRKFKSDVSKQLHANVFSEHFTAVSFLKKIFRDNIILIHDESSIHQFVLQNLIKTPDLIVMDEFANTNLKIAIKCLTSLGIKFRTIPCNDLEKLKEFLIEKRKTDGKVWFIGQSIYPIIGKFSQLSILNGLLEKYKNLYLILDDSYGLGMFGRSGEGIIYETFKNRQRIVMVASLTKGFGANTGAIAISGMDAHFFNESPNVLGWSPQNLKQIIEISKFLINQETVPLQTQLNKRIKFFQKAIQDKLLLDNDPALPLCFIPVRLPEMCQLICSNMLKEGFYVSSAIYPHTRLEQPGIKINITINHTENDLKKLAGALKDCYYKVEVSN